MSSKVDTRELRRIIKVLRETGVKTLVTQGISIEMGPEPILKEKEIPIIPGAAPSTGYVKMIEEQEKKKQFEDDLFF